MANKKDKLDEIFASKLAKNEIKPSAKAWDRLSLAIDDKKSNHKNRQYIWWILIMTGLLGSVSIASVMYNNTLKNDKNTSIKSVNQNNINAKKDENYQNQNLKNNNNQNNNNNNNQNYTTTSPIKDENVNNYQTKNIDKKNKENNQKSVENKTEKIVENEISNQKNDEKTDIQPKKEEKIDNIDELKIKVSVKINKNTPKTAESQASGQEISERPKGLKRIFKNDSLKSKVKDIFKRKNTN